MSPDKDPRVTQYRERDEPEELRNPTPWPLLVFSVAMVLWGVWYYFANTGFSLAAGDRRSPVELRASDEIDGAQVYSANCIACHQATGLGVPGVFPPLVGSRWVLGASERLVQIMLFGINGEIEVRGSVYNGVMPAFARLSDAELAAVTTHIRSSWGNGENAIGADLIGAGRARFPERTAAWNGEAELDAVFGDD
ncbi:MAG: c-type cytochrome [Pseudomonadales bacterium]|nr:c-type cytochrome [Pseudomonadales bacterium]